MKSHSRFDLIIVGGGIVGIATALRLLERHPALGIAVLEKESRVAFHQTGHNSGVLHSGIYYKPGSLKARLSVQGRSRMLEFARTHQIPMSICGKLIVATRPQQQPALAVLMQNGIANGLNDLRKLDLKQMQAIEPSVGGVAGIHCPGTGVIDFVKVAQKMESLIQDQGGQFFFNQTLRRIDQDSQGLRLHTQDSIFDTRYLINCAGLYADRIAGMMRVGAGIRIIPFRGEYYKVVPERLDLVKALIYPVPDPRFPFLGVHFTKTIDGILKAGPNAILALARQGYTKADWNMRDIAGLITHEGFWRMAFRYWKMGLCETYRSWAKAAFVKELKRLVPEITSKDLVSGPTGVRAQCVDRQGQLINDFMVLEGPHSIHVLNVPSPAATASLAIADYLIDQCRWLPA